MANVSYLYFGTEYRKKYLKCRCFFKYYWNWTLKLHGQPSCFQENLMMFKNYYQYAMSSDSGKKQCYMMCSYTWQMKVTYILELNWKEYLKCRRFFKCYWNWTMKLHGQPSCFQEILMMFKNYYQYAMSSYSGKKQCYMMCSLAVTHGKCKLPIFWNWI